MKKSLMLIGLGLINLLHASLHIVQVIQSILLVNDSLNHDDDNLLSQITHNPVFSVILSIIAIGTLWIGIKDYRHHKHNCKHE